MPDEIHGRDAVRADVPKMQMMPRDPTDEMLRAAVGESGNAEQAFRHYRAMWQRMWDGAR